MKTVYMKTSNVTNDRMVRDGTTAVSDSELLAMFLKRKDGKSAKECETLELAF